MTSEWTNNMYNSDLSNEMRNINYINVTFQ